MEMGWRNTHTKHIFYILETNHLNDSYIFNKIYLNPNHLQVYHQLALQERKTHEDKNLILLDYCSIPGAKISMQHLVDYKKH